MTPPEQAGQEKPRWLLRLALAGALLMWLAQPPVGCWPLAYAGVACWLALAASPKPFARRDYTKVWLGGVVYWLLAVNWVRWPCFPLTALGWPLLAMYLAVYSLATVAITRRAVRRWGVPLWIAGPVAWTGAELLQARLFTGFLMAAVSHTHAGQPWLRGVAAYVGAYGVTFAIVLVGATSVGLTGKRRLRSAAAFAAAVGAVLLTGELARRGVVIETPSEDPPRVALIQGDTRFDWKPDPNLGQRVMDRQVALSVRARREAEATGKPLDLVMWPESMFRVWLTTFDNRVDPPGDIDPIDADNVTAHRNWLRLVADATGGSALLVGVDRFDRRSGADEPTTHVYNSMLLTNGVGERLAHYDKMHLVPIGEYIPFFGQLPGLYYLTPVPGGVHAGESVASMETPLRNGGVLRICPTICYESVVPRVVRRHVAELNRRGGRPDVLANVTNDAWFWGASELDMHHACNVFRAVEHGLPMLVAGNGGLSAIIDARGATLILSERLSEEVIVGEVPPRSVSPTIYTRWGDGFAGICLVLGAVVWLPRPSRLSAAPDREPGRTER